MSYNFLVYKSIRKLSKLNENIGIPKIFAREVLFQAMEQQEKKNITEIFYSGTEE